jgi:hypothetical protein
MSRFSVAKMKIVDDLESLVSEIFRAQGRHRRIGTWNIANPFRPKSKASQMVVWLKGARRGAWKDFVSGETGDAVDLVAYGLTGSVTAESRMDAVKWIEDRYGLRSLDARDRSRMAAEAGSRRIAAEVQDRQRREASIARARKFFFSCQAEILGTPVEAYLKSRGVDLAAVPNMGKAIRFHAACEYWMDAARPRLPAMIAAMVDENGRIGACHYTFLKADGSGKAEVEKAKLMFPETTGLMIRLTNGPSGQPADKAAADGLRGVLGVSEGIEDGLSVAVAEPELRMWAAGSLAGLLSLPDHGSADSYLIFKDNDWDKPQAQALFARAMARIRNFGKPASELSMPADWGKDVNDAINR